jgi:hypothetical protein
MVYVGGPYRADVFFSYAHGGDTKLRKWSLRIPDELRREILISLSLPSGVEIFQDPDLNRAGKFADELEANARGAAVLFVILSPYYIKSDWCAKERKWFIEALEEEGRDYDVIFVARALPTERDDLPPELRDRLGYPFHDETKAKSNRLVVRPFGWIKSTNDDLEAAILEVAGNIANRLQRIKNGMMRCNRRSPGSASKTSAPFISMPFRRTRRHGATRLLFSTGVLRLCLERPGPQF